MPEIDNSQATNSSNDASLEWMRAYQTQKRRCDEENGVLRNICKRAKADGTNVKAMILTVNLTKLDPSVVRQDIRDQLRYMGLRNLPVSATDLFDGLDLTVTDKTRAANDIWTAEQAGYVAGRRGEKIEASPYPAGSELFVAWQQWWTKGQAAIAREMGPDAKVASTARERPSRAKQAALPGVPVPPKAPRKAAARKANGGVPRANGAKRKPASRRAQRKVATEAARMGEGRADLH